MKLSVIIPVYNEEKTILEIINRVRRVDINKEIIIVDDGSTDSTKKILLELQNKNQLGIKIFFHQQNQGKGSAIRTGIKLVTGDAVIIQDADLEYDPEDYPKLLEPIISGRTKVVYGSRNLTHNDYSRKLYELGGIFLSHLANFLYGIKITDEATCYKVFCVDVIRGINLRCRRFEFCPEVTAKVAKQGYQIVEVPISYHPRDSSMGKKLKLKDGFSAIWTLIKYRFIN
jgi:glycosyltransferase involved in cell wall biosynthesis